MPTTLQFYYTVTVSELYDSIKVADNSIEINSIQIHSSLCRNMNITLSSSRKSRIIRMNVNWKYWLS